MKYKIVVGKKVLCPARETAAEVAELMFSLIRARHYNAKLVVLK
jgi:hypothetical protein